MKSTVNKIFNGIVFIVIVVSIASIVPIGTIAAIYMIAAAIECNG